MALVNPHDKPALKVLVVEDDAATRVLMQKVLEKDGFQIVTAEDGEAGLALFRTQAPDMVVTDYSMPGMNGGELIRRIQAHLQERHGGASVFVPVVVLTGQGEPEVLKECLEAGAVEFLTKPFSTHELRTRIHAIGELATAHSGQLRRQAEEQAEVSVVKHVLNRLREHSQATMPADFVMETLATQRINGDICAYHAGAPGIHFGMICDPMGHGLIAGISEIPTMDVFNALAARDLPLPTILAEVNRKLMRLLPFGRFSCVLLFRMDMHTGSLTVASAAMPDAFIFRQDGSLVRIPSTGIPLGIQEDLETLVVQQYHLEPGDCFFGCSDGISDIVEEDELHQLFLKGGETQFSQLVRDLLAARIRDQELYDDVSWSLWPFRPGPAVSRAEEVAVDPDQTRVASLDLQLEFHPGTLGYIELGSNLVAFLARQGVPEDVSQTLALLLSEALINAVDHGLLGLDSALKEAGFEAYESARCARLAADPGGAVNLKVLVNQCLDGRFSHVQVEVSDPGLGFDWREWMARLAGPSDKPHGRGLILLKTLARDLGFNASGNSVHFSLYAGDAP